MTDSFDSFVRGTERNVGRPWAEYEDQLLIQAVAIHGEIDNWKLVAQSIGNGRTNKACRKRWLHSLSPSVKKSAWTREEDDLLLSLYAIHSTKWSVIARHIQGRTDDACSKRYREALDPALKKGDWTSEEDLHLLQAFERLGGRWGQIGAELSRSGLGCRNRWRLLDRRRSNFVQKSLSDPYDSSSCDAQSVVWPHISSINLWDQNNLGSQVSSPAACNAEPPPFQFSSSSLSTALSNPDLRRRSTASLDLEHHPHPSDLFSEPCITSQSQFPEEALSTTITVDSTSQNHLSPPDVTPLIPPESQGSVSAHGAGSRYHPSSHPQESTDIDNMVPPVFECNSHLTKQVKNKSKPKLSSSLPVDSQKALFAYVCGHEDCYPRNSQQELVSFMTSKELWDHSKGEHSEAMGGPKPFRCGLEGCGKGWKSINGLQYHLQVSKAHFRQALSKQFPSQATLNQESPPDPSNDAMGIKRKTHKCPVEGCHNVYKQKSGLRYHLTHGHPTIVPIQLEKVPPALAERSTK